MAVESSAEQAPQETKTRQSGRRRRKKIHAGGGSEPADTSAVQAEPDVVGSDRAEANGPGGGAAAPGKARRTTRRRKKAKSPHAGEPASLSDEPAASAKEPPAGPAAARETKAEPAPTTARKTKRGGRRKKKAAGPGPAGDTDHAASPADSQAPPTAVPSMPRLHEPVRSVPVEPTRGPARPTASVGIAKPSDLSDFGAGILEPAPADEPPASRGSETSPARVETPSQKRRRRRQRALAARAAALGNQKGESVGTRPPERAQAAPPPPAEVPAQPSGAERTAAVPAVLQPAPVSSSASGDGAERSRSRRRRKKRRPGGSAQPEAEPSAQVVTDDVQPTPDDEGASFAAEIRIWKEPTGKSAGKPPGREMVINVTGDDECRVAILTGGRLEELFIERQSAQSHVGNIYKGRITNVEPSIQAAFVDFGFPKNGFLHVSDVQPQYFPNRGGQSEAVGKKVPRRDRPPIQRCFRRGQEVIVQITKEGVGTKGPTLTTYLSIPGRFLVMMPGMDKVGLSRKIEDEEARRKMREVMNQLTFPDNIGFILRTAGLDQSKRELQRDLNYLMRLWKTVSERIRTLPPPAELYQDSDLVTRTLRDVYTSDFERIVVDHAETGRKSLEFLQIAAPRTANNIELYTNTKPIFHAFGIEEQIDLIHSRHVPLPSGGTLVIDSTEAMVAIDVNSGKFRDLDDAEETAYKINMEAAEEIARQLRLRDLGGLIVCDFIDMRFDRHKRAVEKVLRDALKKHKERARILRMSQFGLIEMTRQRQRPSIRRGIYADCPHCRGTGQIKTPESMSLEVMRILQLAAHSREVFRITLTASPKTALMVLNERRNALHQLQQASGKTILVQADPSFSPDQIQVQCEDNRGRPVNVPT